MIRALTFDLWDTLVVDDSDEADRAAAGLLPKPQARTRLFVDEVLAHHDLPADAVAAALDAANARFRIQWKAKHLTPHIADRLRDAFAQLDLEPTPGFDALVEAFSMMEVEHPPRMAEGADVMLAKLAERFPLAIISDAIVTPGSHLRKMMEKHGLAQYFQAFVFSDEAGAAKPDRKVFDIAAEALGVDVTELAHVGDREGNDIAGPLGVDAMAVLYTGAIDRGSDTTKAHVVCRHHDELPGLIDQLNAERA